MAGNATGQELCADSPLSTTGNIISILTFAYAIIVTAIFHLSRLLDAEQQQRDFSHRFLGEYLAFESVSHWLESMSHLIPDELRSEAINCQDYRYLENLAHQVRDDLARNESFPLWKLLSRRGYFLAQKTEAENKLKQIVQLRKNRQMFCLRVTQTIIIRKVEDQNERIRLQGEILRLQNALLIQLRGDRPSLGIGESREYPE